MLEEFYTLHSKPKAIAELTTALQ